MYICSDIIDIDILHHIHHHYATTTHVLTLYPPYAGYYCISGEQTVAPPNVTVGRGGPCARGTYCPQSTHTPNLCSKGRHYVVSTTVVFNTYN